MSTSSVVPSIFSILSCWWLLLLCASCSAVHSSELPWIRLTNHNFSSDIHAHPFLLCLATVPWCGESKSLMRELSEFLAVDETLHSLIQLRIVYINLDKSLQRFFSQKVRYPTFTFFWHSTPLKYKGKLRLQNILTAINRTILLSSLDFSLKKLETAPELESFMNFTDKAVILFDFCNYTEKVWKSKHHPVDNQPINVPPGLSENSNINVPPGLSGNSNIGKTNSQWFVEESNTNIGSQMLEEKQPCAPNAEESKTMSPIGQNVAQEDSEFSALPITRDSNVLDGILLEDITKGSHEFSSNDPSFNCMGNENDVLHEVVSCKMETKFLSANSPSFLFGMKSSQEEDMHEKSWSSDSIKSGVLTRGEGWNRTEYRRFANVHQSLIKLVRAYALTPELANFAVIENKSLLSTLGIDRMQNYTWFLMQWIPDWPGLPRLYYENETLESFLSGPKKKLVSELNRETMNNPSNFCNNTWPVILFIDKVSPLLEVRKKCWEALTALRAVARDYVKKESLEVHVRSTSKGSELEKDLSNLEKSVIETQMPEDSVTSLKSFSGQKTLLQSTPIRVSKNPPIKDLRVLPQANAFDRNVLLKLLVEDDDKLQVDASLPSGESQRLEFSKLLLSDAIYNVKEGKIVGKVDSDYASSSLAGLGSLLSSIVGGSVVGLKSAEMSYGNKGFTPVDFTDEVLSKDANHGSTLSFYFADGEDQWKDMVQPDLPYPSLVILDSLKGGKFVFPAVNQSFDYISLKAFLDQFAIKKLQKTYLSELESTNPRKEVRPPFVNRDFHEVDGVPRVTAERLLQLLAERPMVGHCLVSSLDCAEGMHQFWKRDALVLFTAPSCGFCKQMELVFREVHQMLTRHADWSTRESFLLQSVKHLYSTFDKDDQDRDSIGGTKELDFGEKLPRLFQIDCTLNDCSGFFESIDQEQLYPSVILYPAENKDRPKVFKGRSTVQEVLKFIAVEGQAGSRIFGFLRGGTQKKKSNRTVHSQMGGCHLPESSQSIFIDSSSSSSRHAYLFTADATERPSSLSKKSDDKDQNPIKPIIYPTVGSLLFATDMLSKASKAFEGTKILIVKADGQEGFQGLIFNKPLAWNRLPGLDTEMEPLVNKTVLCYGGPVILQGEPFLSLSRLKEVEGFAEVVPGVYIGGPSATMRVFQSIKEARLEAADFWFFLGHAIWGWQQLLNEIEQQWWNLTSYEEGAVQLPFQEWLEGGRTI